MRISDVRVRLINNSDSKLKGVVSVVIDDCFAVHDIKIIMGTEGVFVAMPSKKTPDGEFKDIVHPINSETRAIFTEAIIAAYNEETAKEGNQD